MNFDEKLQELNAELTLFEDPQERLGAVVERVRRAPRLSAQERVDAHRVPACISPVWIVVETRGGLCHFRGDADSPVVRGLVNLLCEFFSESPPHEVAASTLNPLDALGMTQHLSPTRRNGLASARNRIRQLAMTLPHATDAKNST